MFTTTHLKTLLLACTRALRAACGSHGEMCERAASEIISSCVINASKDTLLILAARHGRAHVVGSLLQLQPYSSALCPPDQSQPPPRRMLECQNKVGHCALHEAALSGVAETVYVAAIACRSGSTFGFNACCIVPHQKREVIRQLTVSQFTVACMLMQRIGLCDMYTYVVMQGTTPAGRCEGRRH